MTEETRTLVHYRLSRAREALEEAVLLLESDHTNTCVNRLYYACFYAVSALLLAKGLSATRHSGVRVLFHQNIVKPGLLSISQGQIYDKFFDNRQRGTTLTWRALKFRMSSPGSMKPVPSLATLRR